MSGLNIAALHEAIAEAVPDRDCIVWRERTLSWSVVTDRTRRFANGLLDRGVGGSPRAVDHGWESPHDHVALLLTNGNEYLEAMLGCWKARAASINCNYRYTAEELGHVLDDSAATAIVYHARFAPVVADAIRSGSAIEHLVVVEDGSGVTPVDGSVGYEDLLATASDDRPALEWSGDDRYVVYTGGTTGLPKGVLWRQDDFLASALGITGSVDEAVERARRPDRPRALPAPPFMHGAAHWNAISCWLSGGTVVIQSETDRLDPSDVLDTCARERVGSMLIVGDAFARPLLDEQERRPRDLSNLRLLMTGGAILSPATKHRVSRVLPTVRIIDVLGSSETGRHGIEASGDQSDDAASGFVPSASTVVLDETRTRELVPGEDADGWLAQRGRVPLGYLGDR
ncbi:MAG: AMP-binding protein, partial [Acidimicrobiales bacterium]|nr:AMP-binding protein [Acidimicrobiales bacterium]